MADTSSQQNFGYVISYLLPGFVSLGGVAPIVPVVGQWLQPVHQEALGFGPPIYAIMAATVAGKLLSCIRWTTLDQIHHCTGIKRPVWDNSRLDQVLDGFDYLVQNHFRYYEFAGNMLVACLWAYLLNRCGNTFATLGWGTDLGMVALSIVLFSASRDALKNYYLRTEQLLGRAAEKGHAMYNGNHHEEEAGGAKKPRPEPKPEAKASAPEKPDAAKTPEVMEKK